MSVIYGYIYILTNKINNKKYVGQTTQTFNKRYYFKGIGAERIYERHSYMKRKKLSYNKHLLSAFEKYGLDNFIVEEEFDVAYSKDELDDKEKYYIKLFDSFNNGYNKTTGGTDKYIANNFKFKPNYSLSNINDKLNYVKKYINEAYYNDYNIDNEQLNKIDYYLLGNEQLKSENYNMLINDLFNIKVFSDNRKRAKDGYYKEPKWYYVDDNIKYENKIRKDNSISYVKDTIDDLEKIKIVAKKRCDFDKLQKINEDIEICNNYIKNDCNIQQKIEQKYNDHYIYDKLKNNDIEYTKDIIMKVLKNWIEIEQESEKNPYKTISCIKMDFENVFNKIKLTDIQQNILDNVKKGIIIDDGNRSNFQRVIEKIYKELNKN